MKKIIAAMTFAAAWLSPISPLSADNYYPSPCSPCCTSPFSGFYVGGNVGFASLGVRQLDREALIAIARTTIYETSWTGGVQAGYDWQFYCNCLTVGLVWDWNWSDVTARTNYLPNDPANIDNHIETRLRWFSTLRARIGHNFNDAFLLYFTGGAALGDLRTRLSITPPLTLTALERFTFHNRHWGWTAGFGGEFALFCNWNLNAELLYMRFSRKTETYPTPDVLQPAPEGATLLQQEAWVGRLGVNYRFSFGSGW